MVTETFEPSRPIYAPDNGAAYCSRVILSPFYRVDYGSTCWPSRSYWLVPLAN
jgi:hypothetical protein